MIKALRTGEEFWQAKFDHEIRLHQAFTQNPPPVRVPTLVHTDGHRVLVIEHIPGQPVDAERCPEQPCPRPRWTRCWTPSPRSPCGLHRVLAPVFDYPDRVERYHRAGFFDDTDRTTLHALLEEAGPVWQANHGDPLPANLLLAERRVRAAGLRVHRAVPARL